MTRFWFISHKLTPSRCTICTPKSQVKLSLFFHFNASSLLFPLLTEMVCRIHFSRNQGVLSVIDLRSRCSRQFSDLGIRWTASRLEKRRAYIIISGESKIPAVQESSCFLLESFVQMNIDFSVTVLSPTVRQLLQLSTKYVLRTKSRALIFEKTTIWNHSLGIFFGLC